MFPSPEMQEIEPKLEQRLYAKTLTEHHSVSLTKFGQWSVLTTLSVLTFMPVNLSSCFAFGAIKPLSREQFQFPALARAL